MYKIYFFPASKICIVLHKTLIYHRLKISHFIIFNILIQFIRFMGSHTTWMLIALHVPYSKFCIGCLMTFNWPKHVVKVKTTNNNIYFHETQTNALISFKVYSLSYVFLRVSASSMPSSGSLHVPTELLAPSESLLVKFCTMYGRGF
jgi:hypothetical protein